MIDASSLSCVGEVQLESDPRDAVLDGSDLWVSLTGGDLAHIQAAGAGSTLLSTVPLSGSPSDLAMSSAFGVLYVAQPGVDDGLDVIAISQPTPYCIGAPNSAGPGAVIGYSGTTSVAGNDFEVLAGGMPAGVPLLFFYGSNQVQLPFGDGLRCAGGVVQRLYPALHADPSGAAARRVDFSVAPVGSGPKAIDAGSTWNFQAWYRDPMAAGQGFNLTDGLSASFTP